jgi:ribosomal protein S2
MKDGSLFYRQQGRPGKRTHKIEKTLSDIKTMVEPSSVIFLIDPRKEKKQLPSAHHPKIPRPGY